MFFERHEGGERALLVYCQRDHLASSSRPRHTRASHSRYLTEDDVAELADRLVSSVGDPSNDSPSPQQLADDRALLEAANEFIELVKSTGVSPVYLAKARTVPPSPKYYIGSGKVAELREIVEANKIDVVLFDQPLSPSQERNLEAELCCKVLDRTGLILDIFAQRARSHAGKLQVELAQLQHISTRLIRGWTHLERQKGGIGLRGPGESQLETDRRLLRERIKWINKRLDKVNGQRQQGRKARTKAEMPTIALVGYTNAGKSTLFNALTRADVYAQDQLFATLDTTLRALDIAALGRVVIADTVGFVRDLPHQLVEAFKATLEEAAEADLLLHVIDASADDRDEQIVAVEQVLKEIGAGDIPALQVMNKIDLLPNVAAKIDYQADAECTDNGEELIARQPRQVWLSAARQQGVDNLHRAIAALLGGSHWRGEVVLAPDQTRLRAQLFAAGAIDREHINEAGEYCLQLDHQSETLLKLFRRAGAPLPKALAELAAAALE